MPIYQLFMSMKGVDLLILGSYEQVLGGTTCLAVCGIKNVLLHSVLWNSLCQDVVHERNLCYLHCFPYVCLIISLRIGQPCAGWVAQSTGREWAHCWSRACAKAR